MRVYLPFYYFLFMCAEVMITFRGRAHTLKGQTNIVFRNKKHIIVKIIYIFIYRYSFISTCTQILNIWMAIHIRGNRWKCNIKLFVQLCAIKYSF